MPIYIYRCDECDYEEEQFQFMADAPIPECPVCRMPGYHRVPCMTHTDLREFHKPIEMYSIALNTPAEIRDFKKRCPDVPIETNPASEMWGVPIARSRKQKLQALDAMGFEERN